MVLRVLEVIDAPRAFCRGVFMAMGRIAPEALYARPAAFPPGAVQGGGGAAVRAALSRHARRGASWRTGRTPGRCS